MRKTLKILHTLGSCGLIGGLGAIMVILLVAPQDTPGAYADMRQTISAVSTWVLVPSLGVALVSGLLAMSVHAPFADKGWVWLKAAMGILMFKGVLTVIVAEANYTAALAERIARGEALAAALETELAYEWAALWTVMALSVANVVLGVWRPIFARRRQARARPAAHRNAEPGAAQPTEANGIRKAA
ncbi:MULTISPECIES: DUF2269 family protein [unclassified Roseitalea]|uniref:DUF2269 family protein n=1 Tax=unclassified Roseitalea TaxID=2639107 RepID=UPI00273DFF45|nr:MULTISPECIES: DUF2269 family protein [unclassified Roseitalea]